MNKSNRNYAKAMSVLIALGIGSFAVLAHAGTDKFDKQMLPIVEEYLQIPKTLAADQTKGVVEAATKIKKLATKLDASSVSGEHVKHYRDIPKNLRVSADKLSKAKNIAAMREALKELSKPLAMWATMSKPKGISVMYCSMAPGSWLQRGTTVANPYYGAKMLRCGDIVAGEGSKKQQHGDEHDMHSGHHMQGHHGH